MSTTLSRLSSITCLIRRMINTTKFTGKQHINRISYRFICQLKRDNNHDNNEIERKFLPSDSIVKAVSLVAKSKKTTVFTDIYYDIDDLFTLTSRDIWLRLRNKKLELKWPIKSSADSHSHNGLTGVDFYHETTSLEKIGEMIKLMTTVDIPLMDDSVVDEVLSKSNITRFAEITTTRTRYDIEIRIGDEFNMYKSGADDVHRAYVDIDGVKFSEKASSDNTSYKIGEIELLSTTKNMPPTVALLDIFKQLGICSSPLRGKVLEYLKRYNPRHYSALERSGFVASKLGIPPHTSQRSFSTAATTRDKISSSAELLFSKSAVNFFFTRKCNFNCKFCFHASHTSDVLPLQDMIKLVKLVRDAGAEKINFAGGEPFLPSYQDTLGELVKASKEMGFSSVSIISNGSGNKCYPLWFAKYGKYLDILGVSVDSVDPATNFKHGRHTSGASESKVMLGIGKYLDDIMKTSEICRQFNVKFKINTVVTSVNAEESMYEFINKVRPMRWKIFQVLPIRGENCGDSKHPKKDVLPFVLSDGKFQQYVEHNQKNLFDPTVMKIENNAVMKDSYILIDEYGRLLDCTGGSKTPSASILDVGLEDASRTLLGVNGNGFRRDIFHARGGYFPESWSK